MNKKATNRTSNNIILSAKKGFFFAFKLSPVLVIVLCMAGLQGCDQPDAPPPPPVVYHPQAVTPKKVVVIANPDSLNIVAVGDIMLGTSFPDSTTLPPDSAKESFINAQKYLRNADVTFGNLEGTLLDGGTPAHYKLHLKTKGYLFRMPTHDAGILKNAGFNLLSLANNHAGDFGDPGRLSTARTLDSMGICYAGLLTHPDTVFTVRGVKYGFCSFAPSAGTVPILDLKGAAQRISDLKKRCDIVIVSFHGGSEGAKFERIPFKMESFYSEKRGNVYAFAHNAVDAGADLVFGNGPHVSRAMELYKNRLIAYSLGNFCTYRSVSIAGVCGLAPLLNVNINKKGEFVAGRIISFQQDHNSSLQLDTLNRAASRIKWLTDKDFPQGGLTIGDDGVIKKKQ